MTAMLNHTVLIECHSADSALHTILTHSYPTIGHPLTVSQLGHDPLTDLQLVPVLVRILALVRGHARLYP